MEAVKTMFQDAQASSASLDMEEECSIITIYTAVCNYLQRVKQSTSPLPTVESILEALIYDSSIEEKLSSEPLVLADDIVSELTGTISYRKFCIGMLKNRNLINSVYKPSFSKLTFAKIEKLKTIAEEHQAIANKEQIKRTKSKKKKN